MDWTTTTGGGGIVGLPPQLAREVARPAANVRTTVWRAGRAKRDRRGEVPNDIVNVTGGTTMKLARETPRQLLNQGSQRKDREPRTGVKQRDAGATTEVLFGLDSVAGADVPFAGSGSSFCCYT
jgi:hypothetical protein